MMKIAFVCDWLTGMRGGEKCLKALCDSYSQADLFTLVYYPDNFSGQFSQHRISTSFIQRLPGNDRTFRRWLPLFPKAVESFDLSGYDLVVSFSHCVAKSVKTPAHVPHLCYCHTPVRYAWNMRRHYLRQLGSLRRAAAGLMLNRLQAWDAKTACRVDHFVANSRNVQGRIKRCYDREATVIYPPVDVSRFSVSNEHDGYYLVLSAMVPYKRIDLAVQVFNRNGKRLVIAGGGPEEKPLRAMAASNVEFIPNPDDKTVERLLSRCRALVFPGEEDFGIVPLEAQACGKPVIAYGAGGALETVIGIDANEPCPTGVFFCEQTVDHLQVAVERLEGAGGEICPAHCRLHAERFDTECYKTRMQEVIGDVLNA